ncbi:MAG TPA: MoxR family ATPase [Chthoniobacteraceae bacterium]|jgi:MoxR-like ATPase
MPSPSELASRFDEFRDTFGKLSGEIHRAIVGYDELIVECLAAVFCQGHVLLEGVPGLGKTYLVKVLSRVLGIAAGRVQCTPDLMPSDILGTHIVGEDANGRRAFRFERGPVFANILLVDEINRATPKTQSALLEVMQEHAVTIGGERHAVPLPFFVLATQNPMEMEGTYPLPEAQLDRFFFKLKVPFPKLEALVEISKRTSTFDEPVLAEILTGAQLTAMQELITHVPVADPITSYAAQLILATHPEQSRGGGKVARFVSYGASPRGLQALVRAARVFCLLDGRTAVSVEDVRRAVRPALRHRVILNFEGEAEAVDVDRLINDLLAEVPAPGALAA